MSAGSTAGTGKTGVVAAGRLAEAGAVAVAAPTHAELAWSHSVVPGWRRLAAKCWILRSSWQCKV